MLCNYLHNHSRYWLMRPSPPLSYLGALRPAFVAHLADRLSDAICVETQAYADQQGIRAPAKTHSAILFLHKCGPATLSEIARIDGQSHQLLSSRLMPLENLGLIERYDDAADGRRKPYRLTRAGRVDAKLIEAATECAAKAMLRLFAEMDQDLIVVLEAAIECLRATPLAKRLQDVEHANHESARRMRKQAHA
jgi:DNA-binding MarR family transcriptional regulator